MRHGLKIIKKKSKKKEKAKLIEHIDHDFKGKVLQTLSNGYIRRR